MYQECRNLTLAKDGIFPDELMSFFLMDPSSNWFIANSLESSVDKSLLSRCKQTFEYDAISRPSWSHGYLAKGIRGFSFSSFSKVE